MPEIVEMQHLTESKHETVRRVPGEISFLESRLSTSKTLTESMEEVASDPLW